MFKLKNVIRHYRGGDGSPYYSGDLFYNDVKVVPFIQDSIEGWFFQNGEENEPVLLSVYMNEIKGTYPKVGNDEISMFDKGIEALIKIADIKDAEDLSMREAV